MLQRILVAVEDEGGASQAALEEALALAQAEGAHLTFVHVTSILGEEFVPGSDALTRVPERGEVPALRAALHRAQRAGVEADAELLVGFVPKQVAALAEKIDADLVIVGSRHLTGAKRMLRGSTSRAMLDATKRPLLIVTAPAPEPALV